MRLQFSVFLAATMAAAQNPAPPEQPVAMSFDRAADSYAIYSSLIPLGETGDQGWPRDLWLIQDTTMAVVNPDQPCSPARSKEADDLVTNPHTAVKPPKDRAQDFREILTDFDAHCHERITLDPEAWHLDAPAHLLNAKGQKEFRATRFGPDAANMDPAVRAKYKGAPALYGFSQVYFNRPRTIALVYATHWCGGLCGEGLWIALEKNETGQWKQLHWIAMRWIS